MQNFAIFALLLSSAFAAEDHAAVREVSPEEFHALALSELSSEEVKPQRNLISKEQKEAEAEEAAKQEAQRLRQEKRQREKAKKEGEERAAAEVERERKEKRRNWEAKKKAKQEEENEEKRKKEKKHREWQAAKHQETGSVDELQNLHEKQEEQIIEQSVNKTTSPIKEGKSLACNYDTPKEVLTFFISQLSGGANTKENVKKDKCIRAQLNEHCMPYESFASTIIEPCAPGDWTCFQNRVQTDQYNCMTKTVDWESIQTHSKDSGKQVSEILANWCSHVRLLKMVKERALLDEQFLKEYPALLVLQDHVILDKEWAEEVAKDWVNNYNGEWDLVQLDTFGRSANKDKVGQFRGKNVYRPTWKGKYEGFHAVLINTKSVNALIEKMQSLNMIPIDWLTKSMNDDPNGLQIFSWEAGISTVEWEGQVQLKKKMMVNDKNCVGVTKSKPQTKIY